MPPPVGPSSPVGPPPAATEASRGRARRGRLDKRRAILDAAAEVFGTEGYERASIDAIAARSGVSKPTVYNHFGAKEQLFRESIAESAAQVNEQSLAAINEAVVTGESWREALHALAVDLVQCQRSACAQSLQRQIHAEVTRDPDIYLAVRERAADPTLEALAGRLALLGEAGRLSIPDPHLGARQFLALIAAEVPDLTRLGTRPVDDEALRRVASAGVETFLAAYASPSGAEA